MTWNQFVGGGGLNALIGHQGQRQPKPQSIATQITERIERHSLEITKHKGKVTDLMELRTLLDANSNADRILELLHRLELY